MLDYAAAVARFPFEMSATEVARLVGVSRHAVRQWEDAGLVVRKLGVGRGRGTRIRRDDLASFFARRHDNGASANSEGNA